MSSSYTSAWLLWGSARAGGRGCGSGAPSPPDGGVSLTAASIRREAQDPVGRGGVGDGPAGLPSRRPDDPAGQGDGQRRQGLGIEPCRQGLGDQGVEPGAFVGDQG